MSSPPPGGPPPSQPPYPQYPPQQPYYPQAAPPTPQKSNLWIIIVVIIVIVVVVAAAAWYAVTLMFRPITSTQIRVTGVSFTVTYLGSNTGYFDSSPLTTCSGCPITVGFPNYQFYYNLTLTNSGAVAHNVTGITVSGLYFNLVSATPDPTTSSPVVVNAGISQRFTLLIGATPLTGDHTLTGTITTT